MGRSVFNYVSHGGVALSLLGMVGCKTVDLDETATLATSINYTHFKSASSFGAFKKTGLSLIMDGADKFCRRDMEECGRDSQYHKYSEYKRVSSLTVLSVHLDTMNKFQPKLDIDNYGVDEKWTYPENGYADCEDYQLYNRRVLFNDHYVHPEETMFMVVKQADGAGHLIMAVKTTDRGWVVQDNLFPNDIYPLSDVYNKYDEVTKVSSNLWDWYSVERYQPSVATASTPSQP